MKRKQKYLCKNVLLAGIALSCTLSLSACGSVVEKKDADMTKVSSDISSINISDNVKLVGLGEASHGASEYQKMKKEVFQTLVENNGCHTFIIEGDFGGSLKVDAYVNGAEVNPEAVIKEIGFGIYRTEEMVDIIEWMRSYNETATAGKEIHFYGMDMQRFDNNKEYLFNILSKAAPALNDKYMTVLSQITDDNRFDISKESLNDISVNLNNLMNDMDSNEKDIVTATDQIHFDFARECANAMHDYCEILIANDRDYSAMRDKSMYNRIQWFISKGDGSVIFINGHNGHMGKTSVADYKCLGSMLNDNMKDSYFAIGTDAKDTQFSSQNEDGSFRVVEVSNKNQFNTQSMTSGMYYIDFSDDAIKNNETWQQIINKKQSFITLNVGLSDFQTKSKAFYTTSIVPADTYDAMIIFDKVKPTNILQ